MNLSILGLIGAAIAILLSVIATIVALRAKGFLRSQIRSQIIIAWLLPIFGATFVIVFHWSKDDEDPRDDGGNSSEMTDSQLYTNVWSGGDR